MSRYSYDEATWREVELMVRKAMPSNSRLQRAELEADFAGIDALYVVDGSTPLALRVRLDRPAYAADRDVTFRDTEPWKMAAGTYAPLILFVWTVDRIAKAGKLVDVYRLYHSADPSLEERECTENGDGTSWFPVTIEELVRTQSLLRQGDRDDWAAACLGGNQRTKRVIEQHRQRVS